MEDLLHLYCSKECLEFVNFHKTTQTFACGESIFEEGQDVKGLFIMNHGKVKVFTTELEAKQRLIRLASDHDVLGHRGFGGDWTYPVSAVALVESEVSLVPLKILDVLMKTSPDFTYHFMMFFAEELRRSEEKNMFLSVKERIVKALLMNHEAFGFSKSHPSKLSFTLSRKDIASYAETTYETVIRVLGELSKEGFISLEVKEIHINKLHELQEMIKIKAKAKS